MHGEFGSIDGDEVLLRQAISNLFRNSVEACAAAGRPPQVAGRRTHRSRRGSSVHVAVADDGPGIPPEAHAAVVSAVLHHPAWRDRLGLAIVQKVVVSHNGRVTAANRAEGGAVFTMYAAAAIGWRTEQKRNRSCSSLAHAGPLSRLTLRAPDCAQNAARSGVVAPLAARLQLDGVVSMRLPLRSNERGFTLVDMLAVVAIIGIVSAIAVPSMLGAMERVRLGQSAREVERELQTAKARAVVKGRAMRVRFNCPAAASIARSN